MPPRTGISTLRAFLIAIAVIIGLTLLCGLLPMRLGLLGDRGLGVAVDAGG